MFLKVPIGLRIRFLVLLYISCRHANVTVYHRVARDPAKVPIVCDLVQLSSLLALESFSDAHRPWNCRLSLGL